MALIKCIDCGKEFSDKAPACPNCGCPTEVSLNEIRAKEASIDEKLEELDAYKMVNKNRIIPDNVTEELCARRRLLEPLKDIISRWHGNLYFVNEDGTIDVANTASEDREVISLLKQWKYIRRIHHNDNDMLGITYDGTIISSGYSWQYTIPEKVNRIILNKKPSVFSPGSVFYSPKKMFICGISNDNRYFHMGPTNGENAAVLKDANIVDYSGNYGFYAFVTAEGKVFILRKQEERDTNATSFVELDQSEKVLQEAVDKWTDIIAVTMRECVNLIYVIIGLKKDGTIVKQYFYRQSSRWDSDFRISRLIYDIAGELQAACSKSDHFKNCINEEIEDCFFSLDKWDNILSIVSIGYRGPVYGLRMDGTIVSSHEKEAVDWENIVAMNAVGNGLIGVDENGKIYTTKDEEKAAVSEIKLFETVDSFCQKQKNNFKNRILEVQEMKEVAQEELDRIIEEKKTKQAQIIGLLASSKKKKIDAEYEAAIRKAEKAVRDMDSLAEHPCMFEYITPQNGGVLTKIDISFRLDHDAFMTQMGRSKDSKDASVIGRAAAGAVIAGPAGAVVGALSAVDKNNRKKK